MKNKEQHIFPFLERLLDGAEVEWKKLGEVCDFKNGFAFKSNLFKEKGLPIIRISNITGTSVDVSDVKYFDIQDYHKNGNPLDYSIDKGDVLIAMSGATTAKIGYYDKEEKAYQNQRVGKFIPQKNILNSRFLYHFLQTRTQYIYNLAGGGAQPNLSSNDIKEKIIIPVPSISVQEEIVRILDKFTTLEAELEAELDCRKRQYEFYRNQLLSFDMLNGGQRLNNVVNNQRFLDNEIVEWLPIGSITKYEQPTNYLVKSTNYHESYATPVLTAGKTFILGYTNEENGIYKASKAPVIIFDDFTTANKWVDFDFKAKSSAMKMITSQDESKVLLRYIYYWLNTLPTEIVEGDHKRQWISSFCNKKIPIPCPSKPEKSLEIQRKIVSILDKFDTLVTSISEGLPKEIELRRKQYEYYREQLLSFRH